MKAVVCGLVISAVACSAPLLAQERDRSLERISLGLQAPLPVLRGVDPVESAAPKRFGIFTLLPPTKPGEMIRISVPVGELVTRAFRAVAAANRRREEAAARRKVEAELESFKAKPSSR